MCYHIATIAIDRDAQTLMFICMPPYINAKILYNIESVKGKAAISCSSRFELIGADSQVPYRQTYGHMPIYPDFPPLAVPVLLCLWSLQPGSSAALGNVAIKLI